LKLGTETHDRFENILFRNCHLYGGSDVSLERPLSGIAIESDLGAAVPDVVADAGQVHQALLNLLTNAADAISGSGGRIRVSVGSVHLAEGPITTATGLSPGHYVRVAVADNGSGMDAATVQRIFDPFFTTKAAGKGTGLGLAIVHGVMKGLNGGLMVHSTPGEGTEFRLYFPPAEFQDVDAATTAVTPVSKTARILYVDDEEALVLLMTRVLQRMGHEVRGFSNPRQALTVFEEGPDDFDVGSPTYPCRISRLRAGAGPAADSSATGHHHDLGLRAGGRT
jgi:CheY-like chemotaxis protein